MPSQPDIVAAGAAVLRRGSEVLLVHRPKYDDWSFPKGKVDRGEHPLAAAVREVEEETGLHVRLGRPLTDQHYEVSGRGKTVHYWVARVVSDDDISAYLVNDEIDEVVWVSFKRAAEMLTYPRDQQTLHEARKRARKTRAFVVLRHAKARSREHWRADDRFRPLLKVGQAQAERLVPLLAAYDVKRLVSSSSVRCVATVIPYADWSGLKVESEDRLSEEEATSDSVSRLVRELLGNGKRTLLCTHRPVLPVVFETLGVEDPGLDAAEMLVVHHRRGKVVALERHHVR
jgi:8-oxo-dGTP pyrophosphatase MutT (NUDIX family)/phosphohistidine phosphatase SixA